MAKLNPPRRDRALAEDAADARELVRSFHIYQIAACAVMVGGPASVSGRTRWTRAGQKWARSSSADEVPAGGGLELKCR